MVSRLIYGNVSPTMPRSQKSNQNRSKWRKRTMIRRMWTTISFLELWSQQGPALRSSSFGTRRLSRAGRLWWEWGFTWPTSASPLTTPSPRGSRSTGVMGSGCSSLSRVFWLGASSTTSLSRGSLDIGFRRMSRSPLGMP